MKNFKIHEELITPQEEKATRARGKSISPKTKKFVIKKLMRGENNRDKMFKGVKMTIEDFKTPLF